MNQLIENRMTKDDWKKELQKLSLLNEAAVEKIKKILPDSFVMGKRYTQFKGEWVEEAEKSLNAENRFLDATNISEVQRNFFEILNLIDEIQTLTGGEIQQ